jgi:hypothetical protein
LQAPLPACQRRDVDMGIKGELVSLPCETQMLSPRPVDRLGADRLTPWRAGNEAVQKNASVFQ